MVDPSTTPTSPPSASSWRPTPGWPPPSSGELEQQSGLSVQWFEVLIRLARTPGHRLRMSDLAAQTTLSASGLTRAVDRLEAAGLVAARRAPPTGAAPTPCSPTQGEARIMTAVPVHVAQVVERARQRVHPRGARRPSAELTRRLRDAANPVAAKASEAGGLEGDAVEGVASGPTDVHRDAVEDGVARDRVEQRLVGQQVAVHAGVGAGHRRAARPRGRGPSRAGC